MSTETQVTPVAATAPTAAAQGTANVVPAPKLTAIQIIEQELAGFFKQREQAIANVHAVEGAIQAGQLLLAKLKQAAAAAEADVKKVETVVEGVVSKVEAAVEAEAKKL